MMACHGWRTTAISDEWLQPVGRGIGPKSTRPCGPCTSRALACQWTQLEVWPSPLCSKRGQNQPFPQLRNRVGNPNELQVAFAHTPEGIPSALGGTNGDATTQAAITAIFAWNAMHSPHHRSRECGMNMPSAGSKLPTSSANHSFRQEGPRRGPP